MKTGRRWAGAGSLALAFIVGLSALVGLAGTAQADTAYRYWAYYIAAGNAWQYSQRGPASEHPQDGEVQGWRFAIQVDRTGGSVPRTTPNFAALCGSTAPQQGSIRVGIVLDFGIASDAPAGDRPPANVVTGCVRVTAGANGVDVLDAAVGTSKVRIGNGLICGIDGYPTTECAAVVTPPKPIATQAKTVPTPTKAPAVQTPSRQPAAPTQPPKGTPAAQPSAPAPTVPARSPQAPPSPATNSQVTDSQAAASSPATTLDALRTSSSRHVFPTGAVVGAVIVVGLGIGAAVRAFGGRR